MKYRKLEILPDENGQPLLPGGKKRAPIFPPPKKNKKQELTPEDKEVMKQELLKASDNGTKPLPDIPAKEDESEKARKLREAPDEVIAMALHTMLEKDREGI